MVLQLHSIEGIRLAVTRDVHAYSGGVVGFLAEGYGRGEDESQNRARSLFREGNRPPARARSRTPRACLRPRARATASATDGTARVSPRNRRTCQGVPRTPGRSRCCCACRLNGTLSVIPQYFVISGIASDVAQGMVSSDEGTRGNARSKTVQPPNAVWSTTHQAAAGPSGPSSSISRGRA